MKISPSSIKLVSYLVAAFMLSANLDSAPAAAQDSVKNVTAKQAKALLAKDTTVVVLDVRTPPEFDGPTGHLPRAINIPVQELEKRLPELEKYKSREILVYCRSGNRSKRANEILRAKGFKLIHLERGVLEWNAEFPPTPQKEKK
jgi:adenylyltransferase/sulfurtransferase